MAGRKVAGASLLVFEWHFRQNFLKIESSFFATQQNSNLWLNPKLHLTKSRFLQGTHNSINIYIWIIAQNYFASSIFYFVADIVIVSSLVAKPVVRV